MKKIAIPPAVMLLILLGAGCPGEYKPPVAAEPAEIRNTPQADAPPPPLKNLGDGTYELNVILSNQAPFTYRIRIASRDTGETIAETEATLDVRPLYYCDNAYFVLAASPPEGGVDAAGNSVGRVFVVFDLSKKRFRHYNAREPDVMNFTVIGGKLYAGSHCIESPNGALAIIDLPTGKTEYIYFLKDGGELKAIETWAPVIGLTEEGEVMVRLDDWDNKLYGIEDDHIVFAQSGKIKESENPELTIR